MHDVRFEEDNWESPTLGAWGIGWQVLLDGQEITQFTYFQQAGGIDLAPISGEITYGLERIAMYLQDVDDVYRAALVGGHALPRRAPRGGVPALALLLRARRRRAAPAHRSTARSPRAGGCSRRPGGRAYLPAYDWCLKSSHAFNVLDARGRHLGDRARGHDPEDPQARLRGREGLRGRRGRRRPTAAGRPAVAELLLEIGFEEMPAPWLPGLAEQLRARFLGGRRRASSSRRRTPPSLYTPRRLVLRADVPARQPDREEPRLGPVAQGREGRGGEVDAARAQGFAKKNGGRRRGPGRGCQGPGEARRALPAASSGRSPGRPTAEVLPGLARRRSCARSPSRSG